MRWALILSILLAVAAHAESGHDAWLRYSSTGAAPVITVVGKSALLESARGELARGFRTPKPQVIVLGGPAANLKADGYELKTIDGKIVITGADDRGVLYGAFALLRKVALGESIAALNEKSEPRVPVRWVNHWDNLDGSIERGYGGRSIFWDNGGSRADLSRVNDYGRMLASLGINGASINNVNVNPRILAPDFLPEIKRIADTLRKWGVRTVLSVDFGSPQKIGGLDTFDPLDPKVIAWWKAKTDEIYRAVPDLGGFIIKADSEGRVGPSVYGRTHADAANVIARALKPHGGMIFYRGFVYDNKMDWRNPKNDRARAADDNFRSLDGKFDDNVVIQIKNGPIDFQVREPVSPLFGTLQKTKPAIELQITQEYMGQARHTVFLVPMWKEALDFDLRVNDRATPVKARVNAIVGVSNAGLDENWFGNHMSQANLYGFGRLAWNPDLSARQIAEEWTRMTFGGDPKVVQTITDIQLKSWRTYENYTGPLGLQTLTDIVGNHYGVAVEASERNGWGQWHRADTEGDNRGVGMDRTVANGTGFIGQYTPTVARLYESLANCPDDLLLFMHHVPYTYVLHSGKTVIQHLYYSHYDGAEAVEGYVRDWRALQGRVDEQRYQEVLAQLEYQAGQAEVWRDAVSNWFLRASGIPDAKGRVGDYPGRIEAESARLDGYKTIDVTPWEAASGGKAIECAAASGCSATFQYNGAAGVFQVRVRYFDTNTGVSRFRALMGSQVLDEWTANDRMPTRKIDGSSSALHVINGIPLKEGAEIRIEGTPDGSETAALDYIEIR